MTKSKGESDAPQHEDQAASGYPDTPTGDEEIESHPSYHQVMLDVNRCAGRLEYIKQVYHHRTDDDNEPPDDLTVAPELRCSAGESGEQDDSREDGELQSQRQLKAKLAKLIVRLLIKKPNLHYYQGFHDVCLTYMTLLGDEDALSTLEKLIDSHFNIFMQPTMNETQDYLALIPIILGLEDSRVQSFLERCEVGTIFALSWVITWFSHVIPNQLHVEKIFRFLERQDPHMVLYLSATIVMHRREKLLELEPEMSAVHHYLCQIPRKEKLPIEDLLKEAEATYAKWPPELVRERLDQYRRSKLQVHNTNILRAFAQHLGPVITNVVASNTGTALIVFVVASALALQFDKWIR